MWSYALLFSEILSIVTMHIRPSKYCIVNFSVLSFIHIPSFLIIIFSSLISIHIVAIVHSFSLQYYPVGGKTEIYKKCFYPSGLLRFYFFI